MEKNMEKVRCDWASGHELEEKYHDEEWGHEQHEDQKLFEMLILESMQAGLSWSTILKKRKTLTVVMLILLKVKWAQRLKAAAQGGQWLVQGNSLHL
ncbi:hypothetical protein HW555_014234 [Spodoptera exigua]|uniref:DNA-3-methyladenine glycosylase I n=1 Tax=Spodoptera exigua TaxID=7107 RepID=A0A835L1P2_SPOEX|nr:hypothetical protein HW555_014234 [Spodoptera exigua]